MKKLLFGLLGLLVTISGWSAETNSGPISSVTVAGLVAQNGTPSPATPVAINTNNGVLKVSKNLFDVATATNGKVMSVTGEITDNVNYSISAPIFLKAGTYTWSQNRSSTGSGEALRCFTFLPNDWDTAVDAVFLALGANTTLQTFTLSEDAYVRITYRSASTSNMQLEQGGTPTTYHPYGEVYVDGEVETIGDSANHTATVATLLGVGDNRDTQNINTGAITRRVGVKVLDGTEEYAYVEPNTYGIANISARITGKADGNTNLFMCSHFVPQTGSISSTKTEGVLNGNSNNQAYFRVLGTRIPSLAAWQQWLAEQYANGTPVIIVYPLATPTTESVTGQTMTTAPVNNRTGGVTGMTITTLLSSGASVVTTIANNAIKIATTAYNSARFSPVVTELNDTIATIRDVVTNTINQTKAIADLQATKQTRPDETCPAGKKCLLVEDNDGTPHWYEIIESASLLPDGYTELQYIESTGTQYINTGYKMTSDVVEYGVEVYGVPSASQSLFGSQVSSSPRFSGVAYNTSSGCQLYIGTTSGANTSVFTAGVWNTYIVRTTSSTSGTVTLNGSDTAFTYSDGIQKTQNIYLFANNGANASARELFSGQIRHFWIKDNNILVRNLIPAKNSSGVVGMYDLADPNPATAFHTNAGTGTFTAGPEI